MLPHGHLGFGYQKGKIFEYKHLNFDESPRIFIVGETKTKK